MEETQYLINANICPHFVEWARTPEDISILAENDDLLKLYFVRRTFDGNSPYDKSLNSMLKG